MRPVLWMTVLISLGLSSCMHLGMLGPTGHGGIDGSGSVNEEAQAAMTTSGFEMMATFSALAINDNSRHQVWLTRTDGGPLEEATVLWFTVQKEGRAGASNESPAYLIEKRIPIDEHGYGYAEFAPADEGEYTLAFALADEREDGHAELGKVSSVRMVRREGGGSGHGMGLLGGWEEQTLVALIVMGGMMALWATGVIHTH